MRRNGMMLPAVVRVFFAVDLPATMKEKLKEFIITLKKQSMSHGIRWTKSDNLHITLQFLAEVKTEHLPQLIDEVKNVLQGKKVHLDLTLGELRLFPSAYHPRVIVMDVTEQQALSELSAIIGQGIQHAQYAVEEKPFRGHLTLGRIKHTGLKLDFLGEVTLPDFEGLPVDEIVLFRSEPEDHGSKYTPLEVISLG